MRSVAKKLIVSVTRHQEIKHVKIF